MAYASDDQLNFVLIIRAFRPDAKRQTLFRKSYHRRRKPRTIRPRTFIIRVPPGKFLALMRNSRRKNIPGTRSRIYRPKRVYWKLNARHFVVHSERRPSAPHSGTRTPLSAHPRPFRAYSGSVAEFRASPGTSAAVAFPAFRDGRTRRPTVVAHRSGAFDLTKPEHVFPPGF